MGNLPMVVSPTQDAVSISVVRKGVMDLGQPILMRGVVLRGGQRDREEAHAASPNSRPELWASMSRGGRVL
jgi:hypothetical protein